MTEPLVRAACRFALLCLLSMTSAAAAQQPPSSSSHQRTRHAADSWTEQTDPTRPDAPQGRFRDAVDVVEILVDVQVTDRQGNPILGLGATDFEASLDGEPMRITSVAYHGSSIFLDPSLEDRPDRDAAAAEPTPDVELRLQNRYVVLLFHDLMRPDFQTLGVTAQQSLATSMTRRWIEDELSPGDLVAVASFDYKLKIHQDFSRDREGLDRALRRAMLRRDPDRGEPTPIPRTGPSLLRSLPAGKELRDRTPTIHRALWALAAGLRHIDGRKHLVLFSTGIGISEYLAPALNRSNVDVYTVDISPPMAEHTGAAALQGLARETDGYFYRNRSYLQSLRSMARRTVGYYQLSVLVAKRPDGTVPESVDVDLPGNGFRVWARRHFLGEDAPPLPGWELLQTSGEPPSIP